MDRFKRMSLPAYASAALILLALVASPSAARALDCVAVTEDTIAKLFVAWNDALKTGKADNVVPLYASDAILLPTVKNGPLIGHAAIREYFEKDFLPKQPEGTINGDHNIRIGCNVAYDAGLYIFKYGNGDPETKARYTYVYRNIGGTWLIWHHHSSAEPPPKPKP